MLTLVKVCLTNGHKNRIQDYESAMHILKMKWLNTLLLQFVTILSFVELVANSYKLIHMFLYDLVTTH